MKKEEKKISKCKNKELSMHNYTFNKDHGHIIPHNTTQLNVLTERNCVTRAY